MMVKCPNCQTTFDTVQNRRTCYDCKKPIDRHGRWRNKVRQGIPTPCHRDCDVPNGGPGFVEKD